MKFHMHQASIQAPTTPSKRRIVLTKVESTESFKPFGTNAKYEEATKRLLDTQQWGKVNMLMKRLLKCSLSVASSCPVKQP